MKKEDACKALNCNKQTLAKMLDITPSYLSRFDELTPHYIEIIRGEIAKKNVRELLDKVDHLERRCEIMQLRLNSVARAMDN